MILDEFFGAEFEGGRPVSYTHLDVYKRQLQGYWNYKEYFKSRLYWRRLGIKNLK